nr:uncharacterized protein LOC113399811 [Vanessa tameamea]
MVLYGALIWMDALTADNWAFLRKPQRVIAVGGIKGYRTVSWTAATLPAGDPPWEFQAEVVAEVYRFRVEARNRGVCPGSAEVGRIRVLAQQALFVRWEDELGSPSAGLVAVEAVRPHLSRWVKTKCGTLTFKMTQGVLSTPGIPLGIGGPHIRV